MAKSDKFSGGLQPIISSRLKEAHAKLESLDKARRKLREEIKVLDKFNKALKPKVTSPDDRVAPTIEHVMQGIRLAFHGKQRLAVEQLQQRVTQVLKSQDGLSEQGLTLRVQQGIARLAKDASGFVLAPVASEANSDSSPTG